MLVLASASPRRRELLAQAGFAFSVRAAEIPEDPHANEDPIAYVTRLAREKAEAVFRQISSEESAPPQVVLGADTTVTVDNQILGKPADASDAARMLRLLSGRTHLVMTGVAVVTPQNAEVAAEVTAVRFLTLSDREIEDYVATGEPMDKAGAYAIQAAQRVGFLASKVAISMSWDFRWRSSPPCSNPSGIPVLPLLEEFIGRHLEQAVICPGEISHSGSCSQPIQ